MAAHVLVAEDDEGQAELVRRYLEREGHAVTVVHDGRAAIDEARAVQPDVVVLDLMMPRVDGLDVCRILRGESDVPVLMLTARSTEDDLLLGLDLGADDYMTKPFSPRELVARVRTLLRRVRAADQAFVVGDLTVDPIRHEVRRGGALIECTPGEFQLLATMAAEPGRVFSRSQLLGFDRYITERTVDMHVMNLRKKIGPGLLATVYGVGYKLHAA
ncbi:response regulator transcription factor [Nonomuraea sp. NPDC050556]|uniref:response regulator transcription factor n=1 Tax=Nonomuraea sp. NPDC050556 TaxID=3364369 RepID=UPI0037A121A0